MRDYVWRIRKSFQKESVEFTFSDGTTVKINPSDFPKDIKAHLMQFGFAMKMRDIVAGKNNLEDVKETFDKTLRKYKAGIWGK